MGLASAAVLTAALCLPAVPANAAAPAIPDFSGYWTRAEPGGGARLFYPPASGPGPVTNLDKTGEFSIGDHSNPILTPAAAAAVKAHADLARAGVVELPAWSLCWPSGVPLVLNLGDPVQFLQTAGQITIHYERGMQVRRVDLNGRHPATLKPSWYGHSIGHYEGSDTLVIETTGLDPRSVVDRYGTPHSTKMRVIERYTIAPDGMTAGVTFTVEDPVNFTSLWSAQVRYRRTDGPIAETVCAENNKDASTKRDYPIPVATRADF
jgi:hypothetical protein